MRLFYTQEALAKRGRCFPLGIRNREMALAFPSLPILSIWSTTSSTSLLPLGSMLMALAVQYCGSSPS